MDPSSLEIRELKPLWVVEPFWSQPWFWFALTVGLILLGAVLYWRFHRKRTPIQIPLEQSDPKKWCLMQLDSLSWDGKRPKRVFERLYEIIRKAFNFQFKKETDSKTLFEIIEMIESQSNLEPESKEKWLESLRDLNLILYSDVQDQNLESTFEGIRSKVKFIIHESLVDVQEGIDEVKP